MKNNAIKGQNSASKSLTFISFVTLGLIHGCGATHTPDKVSNTNNTGSGNIDPNNGGNPTTQPPITATYMVVAAYAVRPINNPPGEIAYQLGGTVVDSSTYQPIEGATVTFMGQATQSNAKGVWTLSVSAADCAVSKECQATITPPNSSAYQADTQKLIDTATTAGIFISMGNVTKLQNLEYFATATYMVQPVMPVYASRPVTSTNN